MSKLDVTIHWFRCVIVTFILLGTSIVSLADSDTSTSSASVSDGVETVEKSPSNTLAASSLNLTRAEKLWLKQHPTLRVHNELDWAPFNYNVNGVPTGFSIEYMNALANVIGVELEYVSGNWNELLNKAFNKELDVMLNIVKTPVRQKKLLFTTSYTKNPNVIVSHEDSDVSDIESLKGKTVAYTKGFFYDEILRDQFPDIIRKPLANTQETLKALQFGQVDAVLGELAIVKHEINNNFISGITVKGEFKTDKPEYENLNIAVRNDWPELQSILQKAMLSLSVNDLYELQRKWLDTTRDFIPLTQVEQQVLEQYPSLTLGVAPEWMPLVRINHVTHHYEGIIADYIELISERSGLQFKLVVTETWQESLDLARAGELDILGGTEGGSDLSDSVHFTDPFFDLTKVVVKRAFDNEIKGVDDLSGKVVGVAEGHKLEETFRKKYPDIHFKLFDKTISGLKALENNEIDAYIDDLLVSNHLINQYQLNGLVIASTASFSSALRIGVSKQLPKEIVSILNRSIRSLEPEDRTEILDAWVSSQTRGSLDQVHIATQITQDSDEGINNQVLIEGLLYLSLVILFLMLLYRFMQRFLGDKAIQWFHTGHIVWLAPIFICIFLLVIFFAAYTSLNQIEKQSRLTAVSSLQSVMRANYNSLSIWIEEHKDRMNLIAKDPLLVELTKKQLDVPVNKFQLQFDPNLEKLRNFFYLKRDRYGDSGFFIISPDNVSIASMRDKNIGIKNPIAIQRPEALKRVFDGETVMILPIRSDVQLASDDDSPQLPPTMFFAAPVRDDNNQVIAAVTIRVNPLRDFSRLLQAGQLGQSGETYAFDNQGRMITQSRFESDMISSELIPSGVSSILNIAVKDPGANLLLDPELSLPVDKRPYTLAVKSALSGVGGNSADGYRDYRGVSVLGAWAWFPDSQFGIATEINEDEALNDFKSIRVNVIFVLGLCSLLAIFLTGFLLWMGRRANSILKESNDQLEEKVEERTVRLQGIIDTAADGIITIDERGVVSTFSPAAEKIFGYRANEIIGNKINCLMAAYDNEHHDQYMGDYVQSGIAKVVGKIREVVGRRKDGSEFPLDLAVGESTIGGDKIYTGVVRDITKRKLKDQELIEAKETAEAATKSKSDFLANMSHEIRTPMNAIIGMSHLALQTELTRKQQDYISKTFHAANSLLGIINDILDFSKIEAGKLDIEQTPFFLDEVMTNIANVITVKTNDKDLEFLIFNGANVPNGLVGDPLRLGQVLINLANNAVKFTSEGEVIIKSQLLEATDTEALLRFQVTDTGIGLSDEQMAGLFQAFSQADTSTTRKFGGTGLGLSISKSIVEMMGGSIGVESELGKGSTFYFTARFGLQSSQPWKRSVVPEELSNINVLIVDDSAEARDILGSYMMSFGLNYQTAESGTKAIEMLVEASNQQEPFDIVLMDYKMPSMDGIETSLAIQGHQEIETQPKIIMITSYAREEIRKRAEQAELKVFLSKPVSGSTLFDAIFTGVFGEESGSLVSASVSDDLGEELVTQIQGAHVLLVEDNEVNQQVAVELLEHGTLVVDVVNNGQEAVDALKEPHNYDAVLMDIQMPVMDGYTASRFIREQLGVSELPIIAMTANAMAGDREKCIDAGMNDHIAKPIDPKEMFATLARWISHEDRVIPEALLERIHAKDRTQTALPDMPGFDVEGAVRRVGGNVKSYLNTLAKVVASEEDFDIRIRAEVERQDIEAAERAAHTLKGVAGNIGASDLQALAGELETKIAESGLNAVDALIESIALLLSEKLAVIRQVISKPGASSTEASFNGKASVDYDAVSQEIDALAHEIDEFDATAEETSQRLLSLVQGSMFETPVSALHSALQDYDFDKAHSQLEELKSLMSVKNEAVPQPMMTADLMDALAELLTQVESFDSTAEESVDQLLEQPLPSDVESGLSALKSVLANYDFDEAEGLLTRLMTELNADSDE